MTSFQSVPVVDVSGLAADDPRHRATTAAALGRAAREVGFAYVTGTGIAQHLVDDLLSATQRYFALPLEEKMRHYIGTTTNHRGYVPEGEEVFAGGTRDRKEAFDLGLDVGPDDADYLAGNPLIGPNLWPELRGFREAVSAYYDAVFALGRRLLRGFALALGLPEDHFDTVVTKPPAQLRLLHYPHDATPGNDAPGAGAHSDYECFTLLKPTAPGLEVLNGDGEWIDVPPLPDCWVLNIGDMLELWTNGEFVATSHRVRAVADERYSFPLFFTVDYPTFVEPLPQFVSTTRPARPGLVAGEHLFAQTAQTFTYLRERLARHELSLPDGAVGLSSFGREKQVVDLTETRS